MRPSKNFIIFTKKFYKHRVVLYVEVIRPIFEHFFFFFLRKDFTRTKNTKKKNTKYTKTYISKQKRQYFHVLKTSKKEKSHLFIYLHFLCIFVHFFVGKKTAFLCP